MTYLRRQARSMAVAATIVAFLAADIASAADRINLGALRFTSHSATFIAFEKGYFAEHGLEVDLKFFQAAQPMAVAIASGDLDFGVTAISGALINLAQKDAVKVIGGVMHEEAGIAGSGILVSNQAYADGVTTPAQLQGRSLAITQHGSSFHYMAARIADREGFTLGDLQLKPLQKVGAAIAALKSGQVDAFIIAPHIARPLDKSGNARLIGWINDYAPDYQVTTIFTSTKNVTERAALVENFIAAYRQGLADYRMVMLNQEHDAAATEAMVELIHKYVYADQPYDKAAPKIKVGAMSLNENARLDLGNIKHQLDWFKAEGLVSNDVTLEQLVDTRFTEVYNLPK